MKLIVAIMFSWLITLTLVVAQTSDDITKLADMFLRQARINIIIKNTLERIQDKIR